MTSFLVFGHSNYVSHRKYDCQYMIVTYVSAVLEKLSTIFYVICEIHRFIDDAIYYELILLAQ